MPSEIAKFSSSSVEVTNCITQVCKFWHLVNWPYYLGAQYMLLNLIENLTRSIVNYANLIKTQCQKQANLLATDLTLKEEKKMSILQKFITNCNNIEKVRETLKTFQTEIEHRPDLTRRRSSVSSSIKSDTQSPLTTSSSMSIEPKITETNAYLIHVIEQILCFIFDYKVNFFSSNFNKN